MRVYCWETICSPKDLRGWNIRDLHKLNIAYMTKLGCLIYTSENTLWTQVFKAKYKYNPAFRNPFNLDQSILLLEKDCLSFVTT